jgi:hypothetical protein
LEEAVERDDVETWNMQANGAVKGSDVESESANLRDNESATQSMAPSSISSYSEKKKIRKALANNDDHKSKNMYVPPDDENFARHGVTNLVIKFQEDTCEFELDESVHRESMFYRVNMLDGVMEEFLGKLN